MRFTDIWHSKKVGWFLLGFGVLMAYILVTPELLDVNCGMFQAYRGERLDHCAQAFLSHGKFDFSMVSHTIGYTFYFPIIMSRIGISGNDMYCLVQSLAGFFVLSVYPILVWMIFKSKWAAICSPILIHFTFGDRLYICKCTEYWSPMWANALGIPLLILYAREENLKKRYLYIGLISCVCMLSNVMRPQSGFPLLIMCFVLIICKELRREWKKVLVLISMILLCVLPYNVLEHTVPQAIANHWGYEGKNSYNSSPWHSLLIGLGSIDNEYNLEYRDESGEAYIKERYPEIEYLSEEYFSACKTEYLKILKADPLFVVKGWIFKGFDCIKQVVWYLIGKDIGVAYKLNYYILILFCVIASIRLRKYNTKEEKKKIRHEILLILLVTGMSFYSGVLVNTWYPYIWGAVGSFGLLVFWMVCNQMSEMERIENEI